MGEKVVRFGESEQTKAYREELVEVLRRAADALEGGENIAMAIAVLWGEDEHGDRGSSHQDWVHTLEENRLVVAMLQERALSMTATGARVLLVADD